MGFVQVCISSAVGDYIVEVRTHNYSNPDSLLFDETCCDLCGTWYSGCDNVFYYCLRNLSTSRANKECAGGNRSLVNSNDAPLNFSKPTVLGLPNPLPLQGLTREWNVSYIT